MSRKSIVSERLLLAYTIDFGLEEREVLLSLGAKRQAVWGTTGPLMSF